MGVSLALMLAPGCRGADPQPLARAPAGPARVIELDPPEDRQRSPYTGWTRAHYEAVFARLLIGFLDHRTLYGARTRYPGGERLPAAMEGATRMLPALGAWLACPCNPDRIVVDGRELDVAEIARTIVVHGTDPRSPDYWQRSKGGWDQREVEAAAVLEFLVRSRARVWDRLGEAERRRIAAWLPAADEPLDANWLAFQIARNSAQAALGLPYSEAGLRAQLDRLEGDYAGDGFYRDGHAHRFDLYNAFVVHPELSLWRATLGAREPERAARIAERTAVFLAHFPYLFDARGRVAPIGRSLGYRSGVLAALHASLLVGDEALEPGLARRLSAGNLRFHVEAGMFDPNDVLTRGYEGEQPGVVEPYLRPGSQYFTSRALAVLALPPEHPFWTATEQPLPADRGDFVHTIPAVGWTLTHDADGAGLILHNAGASTTRGSVYDKYARLGYPAATWYAIAGAEHRAYDAQVISAGAGRFDRRRSGPNRWAVAPGLAWTRYAMAPETGERPHQISTATLADPRWVGPASVRLSCVQASSDEPARAYEGSYAIALGPTPRYEVDAARRWAYLDSGAPVPASGAGAVLLADLFGWSRVGAQLDLPGPVAHVLAGRDGGEAGFVGLGVDAAASGLRCFASLVRIDVDPFEPSAALKGAPMVEFVGSQAWVSGWAGTTAWVDLGADATERSTTLAGVTASGPVRALWVGPSGVGQRRIVAVGVRSLSDEHGTLVRAHEGPITLACELGPATLRCELDGPATLRRPEPARTVRTRPSGWTGAEPRWRSEPLEPGLPVVEVPRLAADPRLHVIELD